MYLETQQIPCNEHHRWKDAQTPRRYVQRSMEPTAPKKRKRSHESTSPSNKIHALENVAKNSTVQIKPGGFGFTYDTSSLSCVFSVLASTYLLNWDRLLFCRRHDTREIEKEKRTDTKACTYHARPNIYINISVNRMSLGSTGALIHHHHAMAAFRAFLPRDLRIQTKKESGDMYTVSISYQA